jgi:hypothetical protein
MRAAGLALRRALRRDPGAGLIEHFVRQRRIGGEICTNLAAAFLAQMKAARRPRYWREKVFSQGVAWKALISAYISAIPFSGDASCMPMQSMSDGALANAVHSASSAKVGVAARASAWPAADANATRGAALVSGSPRRS